MEVNRLKQTLAIQKIENAQLKERNASLEAEVRDLQQGVAAIEERARSDLGMIKRGETFYHTVDN